MLLGGAGSLEVHGTFPPRPEIRRVNRDQEGVVTELFRDKAVAPSVGKGQIQMSAPANGCRLAG